MSASIATVPRAAVRQKKRARRFPVLTTVHYPGQPEAQTFAFSVAANAILSLPAVLSSALMTLGETRGLIWVIVGVGMLAAMFYLRHNDPNSTYLPALKWLWLPITLWGAFLWYIDRKRRR